MSLASPMNMRKTAGATDETPMRVVHYVPSVDLRLGGVITAVLELCRAQSDRGLDAVLLTCNDRDAPAGWRGRGSPAVSLLDAPGPGGRLPTGALAHAQNAIDNADVLHLHGAWTPSNLQLARLAQKRGTPYIVSPHGMLDDWPMSQKPLKKRLFHKLVGARFLRRAAFVHCTAEDELRQSSKWFPREKGRVIPVILDLEAYRDPPPASVAEARFPALTTERPTLLFLSRIHVKKGLEHLIEAGAILRRRGRPCDILIAGAGDDDYVASLRRLAEELDVGDLVSFLGMVVGDEKISLFAASDVFVLPTFQENFGFVLIESLAGGTPVVTTKGVDIWRELESSGGGRIIEHASGVAVADAVAAVLDADPRGMGASGRKWVFAALAPRTLAGAFEAMYRDCL